MQAYRTDIEGLRALAVILVIAYHYQFPGITGGFVGVDVFFVISGFVITQLLMRSLAEKTFSFATFYSRRIRRLARRSGCGRNARNGVGHSQPRRS